MKSTPSSKPYSKRRNACLLAALWVNLLWAGATTNSQAKDFGLVAPAFPIGELDMLEWIEHRLKQFEANGKMADLQDTFTQRVKASIQTPTPVQGLLTTTSPRTFYVDPTVTLTKDLLVPNTGQRIAKAGTRINPFDPTTWPAIDGQSVLPNFKLSKVLVFFDARDAKQRRFARQYTHTKPIKWVLTGGSPNAMAALTGQQYYFAQQGVLTKQLHITHLPAIAYQEGTRWRIDEVDVSGLQPLEIE